MKIIIIGYGWLGQQLALPLLQDGHQLYVTRRSADVLTNLPTAISGLVLDLRQPDLAQDQQLLALFHDALVLCAIPPGRSEPDNTYQISLQSLYQLMVQAPSRAVIHFSSTGIYQGCTGEVDECSELLLHHPRVQLLNAGEQALKQFPQCITLRLAGLMGPGRHPGHSVAGKTLSDPNGAVNMVHAADILAAINALISDNTWFSAVYNLSCPELITREKFYLRAAESAQTEVTFIRDATQSRRVLAEKFSRRFDFRYRFSSAPDALMHCF